MSYILQETPPLYIGNLEKNNQHNERIYDRNVPSEHLENWFSPTPISSKHSRFPVLFHKSGAEKKLETREKPDTIPVEIPAFNTRTAFAAGMTRTAPFRGFSENVDVETALRNQFYALQKADQAVYVPSSGSSLYHINTMAGRQEEQTHPLLFHRDVAATTEHPYLADLGRDHLFNHTRTQMRGAPQYH